MRLPLLQFLHALSHKLVRFFDQTFNLALVLFSWIVMMPLLTITTFVSFFCMPEIRQALSVMGVRGIAQILVYGTVSDGALSIPDFEELPPPPLPQDQDDYEFSLVTLRLAIVAVLCAAGILLWIAIIAISSLLAFAFVDLAREQPPPLAGDAFDLAREQPPPLWEDGRPAAVAAEAPHPDPPADDVDAAAGAAVVAEAVAAAMRVVDALPVIEVPQGPSLKVSGQLYCLLQQWMQAGACVPFTFEDLRVHSQAGDGFEELVATLLGGQWDLWFTSGVGPNTVLRDA